MDGASLTVTFDEDLNEWSLPAGSAFTATATPPVGTARDIAGTGTVFIDEAAVTLTLAAAVAHGETVTVAYSKPGSNPVRDYSGNETAAFSGRAVANRTPDTTAPSVSSVSFTSTPQHDRDGDAAVETYGAGDAVEVTVVFSEAVTVDAASVTPSLALTVGSGTREAAWASGSGTAELIFRYTVAAGDLDADGLSIGADALALNGGTLKDASDNAASLTHAAVAAQAGHKVDGVPPSLRGAALDGASLTLTFDEDLAVLGAAELGDLRHAFLVQGAHHLGTSVPDQSPSGIAIDGKTATLTLGSGVLPAREASVEYDTGATASPRTGLRDAVGNAVGSFLRSVRSSTAGTAAPLLERAEVAGAALTLTFDAALDAASAPAGSRFWMWIEPFDPSARRDAVRGTGVAHVEGAVVRVSLASPVGQHDSARLGYWKGDDENPLRAAGAGPEVADIGAFPAVVLDRTPPELTHAVAAGAAVTLYYSETLDRHSTPASDDFTVAVSGGVDPDVTGVAVNETAVTLALGSAVAADETATVSYTPGTERVRDLAGNDADQLSNETLTNEGGSNTEPLVLVAEDADADPPVYPAVVDLRVLTLTYVHPLDPARTPSKEAFSLSATGLRYSVNVESVAVRGSSVELGLWPEVHPCDGGFTVRYVKPAENALRNVWGTDAEGLSGQAVTNANAHRCADPSENMSANVAAVSVSVSGVTIASDPGPDGVYTEGETVEAAVMFDAPVMVDTSGGTPTLALIADGTILRAVYVSGSGTARLAFAYRVSEADGSLGAVRVAASGLRLNGGTISDEGGAAAALGFGAAPGVTGVSLADQPDGRWAAGDKVEVTLVFAEPVTVTGSPSVGLVLEGTFRRAAYVGGSGTDALTFAYTLAEDDGPWGRAAVTGNSLDPGGGSILSAGGGLEAALAHPGASRALEAPAVLPALSVADAQAPEGGTLRFALRLDRASDRPVSVYWATVDGSARAGEDIPRVGGKKAFLPGIVEAIVEIPVKLDKLTEGEETFTLVLSSPEGATIADGEAVATITDAVPVVPPLTASFAGMPAEHDGQKMFSFELVFSDDFPGKARLQGAARRGVSGDQRPGARGEAGGAGAEPALDALGAAGLPRGRDGDAGGGLGDDRGRPEAREHGDGDGPGAGAARGGRCARPRGYRPGGRVPGDAEPRGLRRGHGGIRDPGRHREGGRGL